MLLKSVGTAEWWGYKLSVISNVHFFGQFCVVPLTPSTYNMNPVDVLKLPAIVGTLKRAAAS